MHLDDTGTLRFDIVMTPFLVVTVTRPLQSKDVGTGWQYDGFVVPTGHARGTHVPPTVPGTPAAQEPGGMILPVVVNV